METLRLNPFKQIHQGLRALLYHTALHLQHTDFTDAVQTEAAVAQLQEVIDLFDSHAEAEDTLVFPMVAAYAPDVIADFEQQHVKDHQLGASLKDGIAQLRAAQTPAEQIVAGEQLQVAFTEFTAFNLTHMNGEENSIKSLLWQYYTDEQLHAKTMEIAASIPPAKNGRYSFWMLKGMAANEILQWYRQAKATAPQPVFEHFLQLAQSALSTNHFQTLVTALGIAETA